MSDNTFDIAPRTVRIVVEKNTLMADLHTKLVSVGGFTAVETGLVAWVQDLVENRKIILAFNKD
jgi:hypothetical protein